MAAEFFRFIYLLGVNAPFAKVFHALSTFWLVHLGEILLRFLFYLLGFPMAGSHRGQKTPAHTATVTAPDSHRIS